MIANDRVNHVRVLGEDEIAETDEPLGGSYVIPIDPMEGLGCDSCE